MPTSTEIKNLIATEFGFDCDATYSGMFDVWYSMYTDKDPTMLYMLMQRHSILYLLAQARKKVDVTIGFDELKKSQEFKNLLDLFKAIDGQIKSSDPLAGIPEMVSVSGSNDYPDAINEQLDIWNQIYGVKC